MALMAFIAMLHGTLHAFLLSSLLLSALVIVRLREATLYIGFGKWLSCLHQLWIQHKQAYERHRGLWTIKGEPETKKITNACIFWVNHYPPSYSFFLSHHYSSRLILHSDPISSHVHHIQGSSLRRNLLLLFFVDISLVFFSYFLKIRSIITHLLFT